MFTGKKNDAMEELLGKVNVPVSTPKVGEVIEGEVIKITGRDVIVHFGGKKDGVIPFTELGLEEGETVDSKYQVGSKIKCKILKSDDGSGSVLLSCRKLKINENIAELEKAYEEKTPITVKISRAVNGGVIADYKEVSGFIPLSHLSTEKFIEKGDDFVGQTLNVIVIKLELKKNKIIFSLKEELQRERQEQFDSIINEIEPGNIIEGEIVRFADYGAFVDLGGIDGLLHISEMSWGKINHPKDLFELGEKVNVVVLSINKDTKKISLSLKKTKARPWDEIGSKYKEGDIVSGKIVQIKEYGAFIELEQGLDGLVHISEISHQRIENVGDVLKVGDHVQSKIIGIDPAAERISLSIKKILPKPEEMEEKKMDEDLEIKDDSTTRPEGENRDPEHEIPDPNDITVDVPYKEGKDPEHEMPDPDNTNIERQDPLKDPEEEIPEV